MADYTFGGTDEENAELKKLNTEVVSFRRISVQSGSVVSNTIS